MFDHNTDTLTGALFSRRENIGVARSRCALWIAVFCAACATSEPVLGVEERGVVDCSEAADQARDQPDAYCDLLCRVPGGVDECPVGTPCSARAQTTRAEEDVVDSPSVCSERLRSCTQLSARERR
jgi:hypothetical protein